MQSLLPATPEAWGFASLVFGTVAGGVGYLVRRWSERKVDTINQEAAAAAAEKSAEVEAANRIAATAALAASQLAESQQRLINAAERREVEANKRMDAALAGMSQLQLVTTELTQVNKAMLEEVRVANRNVENLARQLSYGRRETQ